MGRGFKRVHDQKGKARPLNLTERSHLAIYMLAFVSFLLALGRPCPSSIHPRSMRPRSMCVHAKVKKKKPVDKQWKEKMQSAYEGGIK